MSGAGGGGPPPERARPPVPFVASIAFGAVGFVLLAAGVAAGSTGLAVAGFAAGSLSLGAALYWRSLLISAWAAKRREAPPR